MSNDTFSGGLLADYSAAAQGAIASDYVLRWKLVGALFVMLIVSQVTKMIYRAHIDPLRAIPGPWISSATSA